MVRSPGIRGLCGLIAAIWATGTLAGGAGAGELSDPPVIVDGRTLEFAGNRVRLDGIEVPDLAQKCRKDGRWIDCGLVAASQLADITAGTASIVCEPGGRDADGIRLATCRADGYDLSGGMVYAGWALAEPTRGSRYLAREKEARAAGRGIWRYEFVRPSDWRRGRRLPAATR